MKKRFRKEEKVEKPSLLLGDMLVRYKNDITALTEKQAQQPKDENSQTYILEVDGAKLKQIVADSEERLRRQKEGLYDA